MNSTQNWNSLPQDLALRLTQIFSPQEISELYRVFTGQSPWISLRIHSQILSQEAFESELQKKNIKFTSLDYPCEAYLIDRSHSLREIWDLDSYISGAIYLQSISSQLPVLAFLEQTWKLRILDACAAPGGKTSQLSRKYPEAEIFAFEPHKIRYEKLAHNLKKLWCTNVTAIHDSVQNISKYISDKEYFDMILIDAPCSGEWSLRFENTEFLENWSLSHIQKNYKRQKAICDSSLPYLKIGGELVYSTCTLAPEENEWVVHYLLCHYPELLLEKIDFSKNKYIKHKEPLKKFWKYSYKKEISELCLRIIPSEFSEWFFISKFRKWIL